MAEILDGNRLRDQVQAELKPRVAALAASRRPPGLVVVLVGNNPASEIYVRNKVKSGAEQGLDVQLQRLPDTATLDEVLHVVGRWNQDEMLLGWAQGIQKVAGSI